MHIVNVALITLVTMAVTQAASAQEKGDTYASLEKLQSIIGPKAQLPMSKIPTAPKMVYFVCGVGTSRSVVCTDGTRCCLANSGSYFCCHANTRCGDDGYCH
jgi:hypothetical protein